ncbi:putative epidermal cell surface receptor isoform X2 [Macrosteles quadrilineatus]|uniref:putative epidermal cell surface receptor isoform X2 n=1 Tax=Macrosteles quadrilineatus TaxID=74068 RepID=UPI0023E29908|nr:putative epidermal cell surface receptor isoform X2 [Macrosteles quadrilineatus]
MILLVLVSVSCVLAQETTTVLTSTSTASTATDNVSTNSTSETTTTPPHPPPEPPNTEKEGRAVSLNSTSAPGLPPLDDVTMDDEDTSCDQCPPPLVRRGTNTDPLCQEKPQADHCCVQLVCAHQAQDKPNGACVYKNETYQKGDTFNDACEAVCSCEEGGFVSCKPRCPAVNNTKSEKCLTLPDTKDPCCTLVLCDVSLDGHDASKPDDSDEPVSLRLVAITPLNSSAVMIELAQPVNSSMAEVETSLDGSIWSPATGKGLLVGELQAGKTYSFRVRMGATLSNVMQATLPASKLTGNMCEYKGKNYTRGEEFHDGCAAYCVCGKSGVECASIDCPTHFGLDVLDPHCLSWETQPADFVPVPPKCCPDTVKCKDNGSCIYMGETFPNWADIPSKLSGCEQRCYCEMGNITCHAACPPVPATPPPTLPCDSKEAILSHQPDDECCLFWMCPPHSGFTNTLPIHGFPQHPGTQDPNEIKVHTLEAIDDSSVRLIFSVPSVLVGLHGRVELRYTSDRKNSDPSTWEQQVLAPPDDLIATPELEFELGNLEPNTTYKIKISIVLRDLQNSPVSDILTVKTLPKTTSATLYPPEIPVDPELRVAELNATWVKLVWRTFNEFELQFIDGVQIRYKEPHAQVFSATPLIHRAVTSYTIEDLKPDTLYQVGIYFIPFPDQTTELRAHENIEITTAIENDPYSFDLVVDVHHVKTSTVELTWSGVPYPEDKYINIFRAIYQSEGEREDFSSFKVAKRDSPPNTLITGLKPNTRYHLWLEAYLTNGKIKKSNVKDFTTKAGVVPASDSLQGKLEATPLVESSDYYGPLVAVSILATLAIAAVIILSLILMRKHGHNKAPITAANHRKATSAAYDNPSYKVEIQQETMDL